MLLKCCQTEKKTKMAGNTQKRSAGSNMRLTSVTQTAPRIQRKVVRNVGLKRTHRGVKEEPAVDPTCDNSNDSGLGLEQHQEYNVALRLVDWPVERVGHAWTDESPEVKRKRLEIKIESDDANDNFSFPDSVRQRTQNLVSYKQMSGPRPIKRRTGPPSTLLAGQLLGLHGKVRAGSEAAVSRDGKARLVIVGQPEQQHRARYQTEGSRGAVKDRTGNGFPQVQLSGWLGVATLEVYIGSDCGKVVPHMFYQACRVSGKNSTQCQERTEEGTVIIEVPFEPTKDMVVTCDCVGILKERNVDVEHRFPEQSGSRNKKKSTRCRMVFRTLLTHPDGSQETLQICSQPIACTQPPGVPEICKKSLSSSPAGGGSELFILGKNFLKDTRVLFTNPDLQPPWEASVIPDKEYLQQSHLVCVVPPYLSVGITEPVTVRLTVTSSDKSSEAHCFTYTPQQPVDPAQEESQSVTAVHPEVNPSAPESRAAVHPTLPAASLLGSAPHKNTMEPMLPPPATQYLLVEPKQGNDRESIFPLVMWKSAGSDGAKLMSVSSKAKDMKLLACKNLQLMDPPALVPLPPRRLSTSEVKTEDGDRQATAERGLFPTELKGVDLSVAASAREPAKLSMATGADLSSTLPPSMATFRRFVANDNGSPLPSLSVENFLSRLERKPDGVAVVQPEYVPLDSVTSLTSLAPGTRPLIVSDYRRLSDQEIAQACLESSRARRKPGMAKLPNGSQYGPTPTNGISLLGVIPERTVFPVQSAASKEIHHSSSLDGSRYLSQDLGTSNSMSGSDATSQNTFAAVQPRYSEETNSKEVPTTPPFSYSDESMHASPVEPKDNGMPLQNNPSVVSSPTDPTLTGDFVAVPMCPLPKNILMPPQVSSELGNNRILTNFRCADNAPPIAVSEAADIKELMRPQAPTLYNPYVPESVAQIEKNVVIETTKSDNTLLNSNAFGVDNQAVTTTTGSPFFAGKNITVCSRDIYNFPPENVTTASPTSGCISSQLSSPINESPITGLVVTVAGSSYTVSQDSVATSLPKLYVSSTSQDSVATSLPKLYVSSTSQDSVAMSLPKLYVCSMSQDSVATSLPKLYVSSTSQDSVATSLPKLYVNSTSQDSIATSLPKLYVNSTSQDSVATSLPKLYVNSTSQDSIATSLPKLYVGSTPQDSVATSLPKLYVNSTSQDSVATSLPKLYVGSTSQDSVATSLPKLYVGSTSQDSVATSLPKLYVASSMEPSPQAPTVATSPLSGNNVLDAETPNVPALTLSDLLLRPAVPLNGHCPAVAMKNLILDCAMMGTEKHASNTCAPLESGLVSPMIHSLCSEQASQIAIKDMMMSNPLAPLEPGLVSPVGHPLCSERASHIAIKDMMLSNPLAPLVPGVVSPIAHPLCSEQASQIAIKGMMLSNSIAPLEPGMASPVAHSHMAIKDMMLSSGSLVPGVVGPPLHPLCSEQASRIAIKDMMLRVDVSSTMDDPMISQPSAVTPETARLDALVNSTLDNHIHSTSEPAAPDSSPATNAPFGFACVSTGHRAKTEGGGAQKEATKDGRERREEGMVPHDLTQMSDHDLISYINPSCFDQV